MEIGRTPLNTVFFPGGGNLQPGEAHGRDNSRRVQSQHLCGGEPE